MKYKVYETIRCVGHNNNEDIHKEYIMDELQVEILKQRLEAEDYISDHGTIYTKTEGVDIFRDDQVKEAVEAAVERVTTLYCVDKNTKEWEDVRKALEIAFTESGYESIRYTGASVFHDFEGDFKQYIFTQIEEGCLCKLIEKDWHGQDDWDQVWTVRLTDSEITEVLNLKPEKLYGYLKRLIGVQTSNRRSPSYFAPKFKVGKFFISIQLNYYLWQIRQKYGDPNFDESVHNAVMTEEEFDKILPSCYNYLDVKFFVQDKDGKLKDFGKANQMSLHDICQFLTRLVTEKEVEIY